MPLQRNYVAANLSNFQIRFAIQVGRFNVAHALWFTIRQQTQNKYYFANVCTVLLRLWFIPKRITCRNNNT